MPPNPYSLRVKAKRQELDETQPQEDPLVTEQRQVISDRDRERVLRNQKARLLQSSSVGQFGGDNNARISAIHETGRELRNLEGARAPLPREISPGQIQSSRDDLLRQGLAIADAQRRAAQDNITRGIQPVGKPYGPKPPSNMDQIADANRMEDAFNRSFATPLSDAEIQRRVMANRAAITRADINRDAMRGEVGDDRSIREGEMAHNADLVSKVRAGQLARVEGEAAPYRMATAQADEAAANAKMAADPEMTRQRMQIEQLKQQGALASAKGEAAGQIVSGRAAERQAPLTDPDFVRSLSNMQNTVKRFAGGYIGANREGELNQFQQDWKFIENYINSAPPEQQDFLRQEAARQLEQAGLSAKPGLLDQAAEALDPLRYAIGFPFTAPTMAAALPGSADARKANTVRFRQMIEQAKKGLYR